MEAQLSFIAIYAEGNHKMRLVLRCVTLEDETLSDVGHLVRRIIRTQR